MAIAPSKVTKQGQVSVPVDVRRKLNELRKAFRITSENAMRAIETNVLVRLVTRDDPRQVAARGFLKRQADAIKMLVNHQQLVIQDAETVTAALELPLGTFDRNLSKITFPKKL